MKETIFEIYCCDLMDSSYDEEDFERGDAGIDDKKAIMKNQFRQFHLQRKTL